MLLTGIAVQDATRLEAGCLLEESEVEVRPEHLPSALLDCNVCLPKMKKFFTPDAWLLLTSSSILFPMLHFLMVFGYFQLQQRSKKSYGSVGSATEKTMKKSK